MQIKTIIFFVDRSFVELWEFELIDWMEAYNVTAFSASDVFNMTDVTASLHDPEARVTVRLNY